MSLDKYSRLKIAGNILGFTISEFADELETSIQVVRDVALGKTTSARISKAIDKKIKESEEAFSDDLRERKMKAKTV